MDKLVFLLVNQILSMRQHILTSIKPVYVDKILANEKHVEFRRRFHEKHVGSFLVIYETYPAKSVVAFATIKEVVKQSVADLRKYFKKKGGVTESNFDKYFQGCKIGYAILLEQITELSRPFTLERLKDIGLNAPQSYRLITEKQFKIITGVK